MRRYTFRLVVALLTFAQGVVANSVWFLASNNGVSEVRQARQDGRLSSDRTVRSISTEPCRDGLVMIAPQPDAPLQLSILSADCQDKRTPSVRFEVENVGTKQVSKYQIFLVENYDGREGMDSSGIGINGLNFQPRQKRIESLGGNGLLYGPDGSPIPAKNYVLTICGMTFDDSTTWQGPASSCE